MNHGLTIRVLIFPCIRQFLAILKQSVATLVLIRPVTRGGMSLRGRKRLKSLSFSSRTARIDISGTTHTILPSCHPRHTEECGVEAFVPLNVGWETALYHPNLAPGTDFPNIEVRWGGVASEEGTPSVAGGSGGGGICGSYLLSSGK